MDLEDIQYSTLLEQRISRRKFLVNTALATAGGLLQPFDEAQLAQYGITSDKFLPEIWNNAHYQGKLYALPLDTHPFVMYYNTDICRKAGLLGADGKLIPLAGPNAFIDAFQKVQKATGALGLA